MNPYIKKLLKFEKKHKKIIIKHNLSLKLLLYLIEIKDNDDNIKYIADFIVNIYNSDEYKLFESDRDKLILK